MTEIWKPIDAFPGYEVSNKGSVRSYWKQFSVEGYIKTIIEREPQRILKSHRNMGGYFVVSLFKDGMKYGKSVHVLVAKTFLGPAPPKTEVDHIDNDQTNNNLHNLRYISKSKNNKNKQTSALIQSKYEYVYWQKQARKWAARITVNKRQKHLGYFSSEEDANKAVIAALQTKEIL